MPRHLSMISAMLLCVASASAAQTAALSGIPAGCTYATCAIRIEPGFFNVSLVKGVSSDSATRLGGFGGGVDVLLAGPDSAARHARAYVTATRRSTVLGILGAVAYATALIRTDSFRESAGTADVSLAVAGAGFAIAAIPFAFKAQRGLSRAVWWYNAALPR